MLKPLERNLVNQLLDTGYIEDEDLDILLPLFSKLCIKCDLPNFSLLKSTDSGVPLILTPEQIVKLKEL